MNHWFLSLRSTPLDIIISAKSFDAPEASRSAR
jgi:hypothetical protein